MKDAANRAQEARVQSAKETIDSFEEAKARKAAERAGRELEPGVVRTSSGRSALVFEGEAPRDAREAFERLGAPTDRELGSIEFGREPRTVIKREGLLPEVSFGRDGEEVSRRSTVIERTFTVPNRASAEFAGFVRSMNGDDDE